MAKFKFRLESYLGVREKLEEQKKLEFGKAIQKLEEEKRKKELLEQEMHNNKQELRDTLAQRVDSGRFRLYSNYLVFLDESINKQNIHISKAAKHVEEKRVELVQAVQNRKMLETLKEKDYEEYRIEEGKQEQKIVDEITSYAYSTRQS